MVLAKIRIFRTDLRFSIFSDSGFTKYESSNLKWKFEAVKVQNWLKLTKNSQSNSFVLIALDNISRLSGQFSNYHKIFGNYVLPLMDPLYAPVKTGAVEDSNGSLDWYCLLPRNRSVGIKTTTQFSEAQLDWSRQILLLQKGHPLRLRRWPEQLAVCFLTVLVNASDFGIAARTFLDFSKPLSLSMLNGYFFSPKYRCILCWKLKTVAGSYSFPFFLRTFKK